MIESPRRKHDWTMALSLSSTTFDGMKEVVSKFAEEFALRKPISAGYSFFCSHEAYDYRIGFEFDCPLQKEIDALRKRADELESMLS